MIDSYTDRSVGVYLDALASSEPAPGGGSAAALVGAFAASLAEMVCRLSIGRTDSADADARLRAALHAAGELRIRLQQRASDDAAAYAGYVAATGAPKATPEEKSARRAAMEAALRVAADVPVDVASSCLGVINGLEPIARYGNKHVLADVEVAVHLAEAAARGALANGRVNARLMRDRESAADYLDRARRIEGETRSNAAVVLDLVGQRTNQS